MEVSVLMPVYNGGKFLKKAIESILNQTFTHFEFIIINDGSTDSTEEIILNYNDPRIRYIKNESNLKLIATLNKGIHLSKGTYIVRMDADDISLPTRIEKQLRYMNDHPDVAICGSWFSEVTTNNQIVKYESVSDDIKYKMLYQCHFCHPSMIFRKSTLLEYEMLFDSNYLHAEDYEFFSRICENNKVANLPEVLLQYRVHEGGVSIQNKSTQIQNTIQIQKNIFKKMGFNMSEKELAIFEKLNYQQYKEVEGLEAKELLESLFNKKDDFFIPAVYFKNKLSYIWYHYCYQRKMKSYFFNSQLSTQIPFIEKIKMTLNG